MGVMGTVGLGSFVRVSWLAPLTFGFLIVTLAALALRARRGRVYAPFWLGMVSVAVVLAGRFQFDYAPLTYAGLALLVCASLWSNWPGRKSVVSDARCEC
jgi:hypothetical protein